jgi:phospholipase C
VNGLYTKITSSGPAGPLLTSNPNAFNPTRLTHSQALTCDQNHGYTAEQKAVDNGKMDQFVQNTETDTCTGQPVLFGQPGLVMDYYDGNTVTGLWNYAQNYAMSDNNWDTTFGPSTPGALNLISGQTGTAYAVDPKSGAKVEDPGSVSPLNSAGLGTVYGDPDPAFDDCSDNNHTSSNPLAVATGKNIGDLLNARNGQLGLVPGRLRADRDERGRLRGLRLVARQHRRQLVR